jgi:hypothetical protein
VKVNLVIARLDEISFGRSAPQVLCAEEPWAGVGGDQLFPNLGGSTLLPLRRHSMRASCGECQSRAIFDVCFHFEMLLTFG